MPRTNNKLFTATNLLSHRGQQADGHSTKREACPHRAAQLDTVSWARQISRLRRTEESFNTFIKSHYRIR